MILKKAKAKRQPQPGDYRIEIKFAWFPVKTDSGIIWLERYKRIYEYVTKRERFMGGNFTGFEYVKKWHLRQTKRLDHP